MKELIAAIAGLGLLLYVMRNEKAPSISAPSYEGFETELMQKTIKQIQDTEGDSLYPIDTVYFQKDKTGYIGRFMFLNTNGFYGVQYDVETDGEVLTSLKKFVPPEYENPFKGYASKQPYSEISNAAVSVSGIDMSKVQENLRSETIAVGYYGSSDAQFKERFSKML